jgi:hypothetical protein
MAKLIIVTIAAGLGIILAGIVGLMIDMIFPMILTLAIFVVANLLHITISLPFWNVFGVIFISNIILKIIKSIF